MRCAKNLFIYDCAGLKCIKVTHVNNSVMLVKRCVIEAALRQSSNQGHLSAFKAESDAPTRARLLALGPVPARFPVSRTFTATEALNAMPRAGARPQIMEPHHVLTPSI